jgi:hypothetical protein
LARIIKKSQQYLIDKYLFVAKSFEIFVNTDRRVDVTTLFEI